MKAFRCCFFKCAATVVGAGVGLLISGCGGDGSRTLGPLHADAPTIKKQGEEIFNTPGTPARTPGPGAGAGGDKGAQGSEGAAAGDWSIVIAAFRGERAAEEANFGLARARTEGGIPESYLQQRGPAIVLAYGRYRGPEDPRAKQDVERLQGMVINGLNPYAFAYLMPPGAAAGGVVKEYDLRRARGQFGKSAVYTLQVGVYGREDLKSPTEADLKEARKAAEEGAARLRAEGELAFFHHGPHRSMVTVGVFNTSDFDPRTPNVQSARLKEMRKKHPNNLYNGAGYKVRTKGMTEPKLQESGLVAIPEK